MSRFEDFGFSDQLMKNISTLGFDSPTEIQEKTIPAILTGKDVIGGSSTGSGKTLAFGCGVVENVVKGKGLQSLILTPTRELAEQVKDYLKDLSSLDVVAIYGGMSINPQIRELTRADVVVATPGRLLDHLQRRTINLSKIKLLVLDEADRMLDMGFIEDVEKIIRVCPKERQTLLFSATISGGLTSLINKYLKNPFRVDAIKHVDPSKLKQIYFDVGKNVKLSLLVHLLREDRGLVMVFCNTRRSTDFVVKNLRNNKINAIGIHGGLTQNKRGGILKSFNDKKVDVMVCTDVAARGLHIEDVSHVYNYEIPKDSTDYVHRIGRTARAGKDGKVVNLICEYDHDNFSRVINENRDLTIDKEDTPRVERVFTIRSEKKDFRKGNFKGKRNNYKFNRNKRSGY